MILLSMPFSIRSVLAVPPVPYATGDVFVGGFGHVDQFSPSGVLKDTLDTMTGGYPFEVTGMCFDALGNLRVTDYGRNQMSLFDNSGNLLESSWGGPFNFHPESCAVDMSGNIYVGQSDGLQQILKFSPAGTLLGGFSAAGQNRGTDWIDIAADQCTVYYTSEGSSVKTFDVCANVQGPDFATGLGEVAKPCFALRIRPNSEVIVACTTKVYRLNSSGMVLQTYPNPAGRGVLYAMNLDPDGASFWTAVRFDILGTSDLIYRIDITTGTILTTITEPKGAHGLATFGEITAGGGHRLSVHEFFTDSGLNPLPLDSNGNPIVSVVLARNFVWSTNPGQVLAWVNVTNIAGSPVQSVKVNETLPVDWVVAPTWLPGKGAVHVFFANTTSLSTNPEITDPRTITVTSDNPQSVLLAIPDFNTTALGHPLLGVQSILLAVKLDYALDKTSQSFSSYPRNYTDMASAAAWTGVSYTGTGTTATASAFFVAYAKLLGDMNCDNKIDIIDVATVAYAYNTRPGDARWNLIADLDNDGVVDITDVATVAFYYGTSA